MRGKAINWSNRIGLGFLICFAIAFGYVEAAVAYYLRDLINFHENFVIHDYRVLLNLGFIEFINPAHSVLISRSITHAEIAREAATIVMLVAVSFIAGRNPKQRVGAFMVSFSCWDIFYYVFLKILTGWPSSFRTTDVYFLIPVTWVGPVITPLLISTVMFIVGIRMHLNSRPQ